MSENMNFCKQIYFFVISDTNNSYFQTWMSENMNFRKQIYFFVISASNNPYMSENMNYNNDVNYIAP